MIRKEDKDRVGEGWMVGKGEYKRIVEGDSMLLLLLGRGGGAL